MTSIPFPPPENDQPSQDDQAAGQLQPPDSVRLALPSEARAVAETQRRAWAQTLPTDVVDQLLAGVDTETMATTWHQAIVRPPTAQCRVLVALEQGRVVGFATTSPADDPDADARQDGQLEELVVDPPAQRRGHGSRLLHAGVDTLKADGFARAVHWVPATDDVVRAFFADAGWAADGGSREIGTDDETVRIKQVRLHTDISVD